MAFGSSKQLDVRASRCPSHTTSLLYWGHDDQEIGPHQRRRRRPCSRDRLLHRARHDARRRSAGPWVDRVNAVESVKVDIVMLRTPDGHGRLELTKFRNPRLVEVQPAIAPPNALGLRSVMFTVESIDDTVARLRHRRRTRRRGGPVRGQLPTLLVRGPAGVIVALAEELF